MTDKQIPNERRQYEYKSVYPEKSIIIDGVDVSGCELYKDDNGVFAPDGTAERTELCYLTNDYCGNNHNCYYKQLKAKEQECEKLKETFDGLLKIQYKLADNCKKLKQTLTEIKEIVEQGVKIHDDIIVSKQILQKISEVEDGYTKED